MSSEDCEQGGGEMTVSSPQQPSKTNQSSSIVKDLIMKTTMVPEKEVVVNGFHNTLNGAGEDQETLRKPGDSNTFTNSNGSNKIPTSMDPVTSPLSSPLTQVASTLAPSLKQYEDFLPKTTQDGVGSPSRTTPEMSILHEHYEHRHATSPKLAVSAGELTVPLYYAGKSVLLTGGTGFVGKVFIEKLLRSCPELDSLYCLIRPKNKQSIEARLNEITSTKLFDRLRKERPDFASKLRPIHGDMLLPDLGLSPEDRAELEQKINIVFHSAATIRFDEPLRVAVEMNVVAVRKMLALARKLEHLEAFVHVSTAYANCDRPYIEETVYPPPVEPQKIIDVLEWMDDEMLELFTPKLMGEKPNTYTYTKQLAEHLLITEGAGLPLAIVRPSIVGAAWKEPFPGWIDNYNGPSGIYIAAGRGILRSMKGESKAIADIVPVDIPVNVMIVVAWYTAVAKPGQVLTYHATTGGCNPYTWGDISGIVNKSYKQIPLEGCFRRPNVAIVSNNFLHEYWTCVSHLIPAYMIDLAYRMMGKKPRMVRLYNKLHRSIDVLKFFTCNEWQWSSTNHDMLKHQLTPLDQKMFYFDPKPLHWPTYIENYCMGAKKYVLNEDLSGLPAARAHVRKLRIIRYLFNMSVAVVLWRVLIAKSQFARNLWFFIVGLVSKFVQYFRITSTMHK
ncbi:fatty acyl-CoA reductase 1 [Aplysia californica]|uniref:Fatty acyl-CoA reductase n=1 Tax=Aplysia californica TaxID=6500 RepID=A0ABM1VU39_APLCA|nr:fatty acyl-CoA reductase 1 [Aplysia californica]XP_035825931.1 fatty acyl-CoA reductase 1 [Aplysia californica]